MSLPNSDIARGSGYELDRGTPVNNNSNLVPMIAVLAEMNDANQSTPLIPTQITSRQQAAALYGWGSPMDIIMRILLPQNGGGVNGVPVWAFPQIAAVEATPTVQTITITGTSTSAVTHTIEVGGRLFLEGGSYAVNIPSGSTGAAVAALILDRLNSVLGCPVSSEVTTNVVTTTTRWSGATSSDVSITILTNGNSAGLTYVVDRPDGNGSGTPAVTPALLTFGNKWFPIVVNSYGIQSADTNAEILAFNGNANAKTGQWDPMTMRPSLYLTGDFLDSVTDSADTGITAAMLNDMSIVVCPTPNTNGLQMEGAANYAVNMANVFNNTPNVDIQGIPLPDMPKIGYGADNPAQSNNYALRNALVGLGMSTTIYNEGVYMPQDTITTYAPAGEPVPVFRYARDLFIDMNIEYKFKNLQNAVVGNKQIAADADVVSGPNVVKPKDVVSALFQFALDLVSQGMITDAKSMQKSVVVRINSTNRNRLDISFTYNRSGVTRVVSTVATVNP